MGHCRSLLSDGLMWYKREWGGVLLNDRSIYDGQIALRILKESNAVKSFLRHNPFVGTDKNERFDIHCFVDGSEEADADLGRWRSRYCNSGKVGLRVFRTVPHIQFCSETDRTEAVSSDAVAMSR